nr:LPXTG cell wall anchor domain-containing protein [Streptococcus lutetiensis]
MSQSLPLTGDEGDSGLLSGLGMLFGAALFAKKRKKDEK